MTAIVGGTPILDCMPTRRGWGQRAARHAPSSNNPEHAGAWELIDAARRGSGPKAAISIVVPFYNAEDTIGEQLDALAAEVVSWPWELVLVDDASTDASLEVAEEYESRLPLRIVKLDVNRGAATARNAGVAASTADAIGFLDADDVIAPGWIEAAACAARRWPAAASRFDVTTLNAPEVRAERIAGQEAGLREYHYPPYLPHCGGCGLVVRREAHEQIGGFDPAMRSLEDTDYVWRLQLAGYELGFAEDAVVRIRYRDDRIQSARQAFGYGYFNAILYSRYRSKGMPPIPWYVGMKRTARILSPRHLIGFSEAGNRRRWLRSASWQLGRVAASMRHRVWAL